jgi:hypothetical protein
MTKDFGLGDLPSNSFDCDASALWLYIAVKDNTGKPIILKMLADLSADAIISYNPGAGTGVNIMAGDLVAYWIWAAGDFGTTHKVVFTEDGGTGWYVQDDGTFGTGVARPILVGPGNDSLLTTAVDMQLWQNRYDGDFQYWIERYLPGTIWSVDRVDEVFEETMIGGYWYTGDSAALTYFSPNSGMQWSDISDSIPSSSITSIIVGA